MSVCFEDRSILLSINAVVTGLDVVDGSSLDNSAGGFNMILNGGCIDTFFS